MCLCVCVCVCVCVRVRVRVCVLQGLLFGVYSAASQRTCGNWSASQWREVADAHTFADDWQIDMLKRVGVVVATAAAVVVVVVVFVVAAVVGGAEGIAAS